MSKLSPTERQALNVRVKEIDREITGPRLTIDQVDKLRKERGELRRKLLEDRADN